MGRASASRARKQRIPDTLKTELQRQIEAGRCAYCRAPARPDRPLTREHVIPRARGGRRKDVRIIVPACARCNHHRGCRDFVPFLLARPRRISSFLDYLGKLSAESIREIDPRVYAELYVAIAIMAECAEYGTDWRREMKRLCSGRSLHRRRYAARRAVGAVSGRVEQIRERDDIRGGPSCLIPNKRSELDGGVLEEPLEQVASRLLSLLALLWQVPGEIAERELVRELNGTAVKAESLLEGDATEDTGDIPRLDQWTERRKRKRLRVDRRQGRPARNQRRPPIARGRAA